MKHLPLILYIDNNCDSCEILEILMRNHGFEVISKQNGFDALQLAQTTFFSAVVSEYLLKDMDALELCSEIRKLYPKVPFVFYSAESREEHKARGLSGGANAYLVKPNDLDSIEHIIASLAS